MAELFYHNNNATAAVRSAFYLAGGDLKDNRLSKADFDAQFPGNQTGLVLKVEGITVTNHHAALRYAGRISKKTVELYPKDPLDAFRVDNIIETLRELERQVSGGKLSIEDTFETIGGLLDEKFAVGSSVTIADCAVAQYENWCSLKSTSYQGALVEHGNIVKSIHAARNNPLVKEGNAKRRGGTQIADA